MGFPLGGTPTNPNDAATVAYTAPLAPQFHGVRLTSYGHSFGQVQSPANTWAGALYPARLRDLLHTDPSLYNNRTVSGATMAQIATNAANTWVDGNGGLVTLMGNQNDVGNGTAQATFQAAVRSFLNTMLGATGYPPTVLVFKDTTCTTAGYARYSTPPTDTTVATYNGYLASVVAEFPTGWIVVADPISDGWNPSTMTGPDGQHPNERGMAFLAASAVKALSGASYRQGLNIGVIGPAITTPPPSVYSADNFNRADSSTGLGATSTGSYSWMSSTIAGAAGIVGISSQQAYSPNAADIAALIDDGHSDGTLQMTMSVKGDCGLIVRAADASNFVMVYANSGTGGYYQIAKCVAGGYTLTTLATTLTPAVGDVIKAVASSSTITVYVNGTSLGTYTDSTFTAATKHGMRFGGADGNTARIDNWSHAAATT